MKRSSVSSEKLSFEKVWLMFQETDRKFQETDRKFKETKELLEKSNLETEKQFRETDKKLRKLEELFSGQWGKLIEAMVEGELIRLLNERGIAVNGLSQRKYKKFQGKEYEFDLVAENGNEMVVVEVKTHLSSRDVDKFIGKLSMFREIYPEYRNNKIYGAVAYIKAGVEASRHAMRKGLFVIRAVGESAVIENHKKFRPKDFNKKKKGDSFNLKSE